MGLLVALCLAFASGDEVLHQPTVSEAEVPDSDIGRQIEALTQSIRVMKGNTSQSAIVAELLERRGLLRLRAGEPPQNALADFDEALRLNPGRLSARQWRITCLQMLGDAQRVEAELRVLQALSPDGEPYPAALESWFDAQSLSPFLLVAALWAGLLIYNVVIGWPQKREAGGSTAWLFWVSAVLAGFESLPAVILAGFAMRGSMPPGWLPIGAGVTVLNLVCVHLFLMPPVRLTGTKVKLPRVTDERFLARVAELAQMMGIAVPLVRLWPSVDGSQKALAFVGTIHAPQLVVTDGIIQRLEPAECDAVVAHELAHVANRSLWLLCAVVPVSCAVATAVLPIMPVSLAIPFSVTFLVGLRRLVSRPIEFDCDRRAARAIGFRVTIDALAKIHAVHPIRNSGILSLLVYGTSTHPSRDARLAALYDAAPEADRPENPPDRAALRRHHRVAVAAAFVWGAALLGSLALATSGRSGIWLVTLLWTIALAPLGFMLLTVRKDAALASRRMGPRWKFVPQLGAGGMIGLGLILLLILLRYLGRLSPSVNESPLAAVLVPAMMVLVVGTLVLWLLATNRKHKLLQEVAVACQVHDFRGALELCLASPRIVRRSHLLRYNQAICQAVCGDIARAAEALEQLWIDKPRFPLTGFALCNFLLELNRPDRALEVARGLAALVPGDPQALLIEARTLRRLGRLDEAQAACDKSLAIESENGVACAAAAALALDRNQNDEAARLCERAHEFAPGDAYVRVVQAEVALRQADVEAASAAVAKAVETIRSYPLVFLDSEARRLEALLEDRVSPVAPDDIFIQ